MTKPQEDDDGRPEIGTINTGAELRRWYWRKDELTVHARNLGLKATSGKFELLDRIAHYLDSGDKIFPGDQTTRPRSSFDWHSEPLSKDTVITDSYRNTQNVRRFFKAAIGDGFKFNIAFMEWMRSNTGKTLEDACTAYRTFQDQAKTPGFQTTIKDHNQFNQYTRDFLADNPELGMDDVRRVWALKIQKPSDTGRHVYDPADLMLGQPE
ncbi:MAG: SAP domain-containing protein [Alphaproteobacteria bacterium]|nr:SAP domain-containing protein [Alphaproteobacteria bacterium]